MNRDVLDESVKNLLATALTIQVGMSDVPAEKPSIPYVILNQSPSPAPDGSYLDPEDMPYFDFAIKSVGSNHKETSRTSSRVRMVMVSRRNGQWAYDLVATGFVIVDRKTISTGGVIKSAGPNLFEVNDIYRICVTADET